MMPHARLPGTKQHGTALVVGLLILIVITLIALSSMRSTLLEERMAGNLRDRTRAFEAAEAALRDGESWLLSQKVRPVAGAGSPIDVWVNNGPDPDTTNTTPWWFEASINDTWWTTNARPHSFAGAPAIPHYLVEELRFVPDSSTVTIGTGVPSGRWFYRVTARGTGGDSATEVLLQTTYALRF